MTAAEKVLQKTLIAAGIPTSEWSKIQAGLRDRAFFSAQVESTRFLYEARMAIVAMLQEKQTTRGTITTREDVIRRIREEGAKLVDNPNVGKGGIVDPSSRARAKLIVDTNAGQAAGYIRHTVDMSLGARMLYPCKELIRNPASHPRMPRDWTAIWTSKGGRLYDGRMIALVEDPIWSRISRFGTPYPPFDFNSGMITRNVKRADAVRLGVISEDHKPVPVPEQPGFNDALSVKVPYKGNTPEYKRLDSIFGDQITHEKGEVKWRGSLIRDAFNSEKPFNIHLGKPTADLLSKLDDSMKRMIGKKSFTVTDSWLRKNDVDKDHPAGHGYSHFGDRETKVENIPLNDGDFDMLPTMWRNPDRVLKGGYEGSLVLEIDTMDGGVLTAIVDITKTPKLKTYFKSKRKNSVMG